MILYVAFGSAVGGALRYLLGAFLQARLGAGIPVGTLAINISGSFLLVLIIEYALATPSISAEVRGLLTAGFCGGFTTFSTFSFETLRLMQDGDWRRAGLYVTLSVAGSLAAAFAGLAAGRALLAAGRAG